VCASSIFLCILSLSGWPATEGSSPFVLPGGGRPKLSSPLSPFFESSCQVSAGRLFCSTLLTWARISSPSALSTTRSILKKKIVDRGDIEGEMNRIIGGDSFKWIFLTFSLFFRMQSINRSAEGEGSSFSRGKKWLDHRKRRRDSVGCAVKEKKRSRTG
jgi:hypothetical protein